jgi:serine/threonine protein kinase
MIGKTISHYRIIREIGKGGMGEVYLAEDEEFQRNAALKFLLAGFGYLDRFAIKSNLSIFWKKCANATTKYASAFWPTTASMVTSA